MTFVPKLRPSHWAAFLLGFGALVVRSADELYEQAPISYSATAPQDAIVALEKRLALGGVDLAGTEKEVLRELLRLLDVPEASQVLVFSKTSLQTRLIRPDNPRAIYFSDTCYVGWVPGGLIEIASIDPQLGPVFYHFNPRAESAKGPRFVRDADCLRCHGGNFVRDIPSVFARSLFTEPGGQPIFNQGSVLVEETTPLLERWGGWYVTGTAAPLEHRGNVFHREQDGRLAVALDHGDHLARIPDEARPDRYPRATSSVSALLVLEHQCAVQNALTRAAMRTRQILHYQRGLQRDLKEPITDEPTFDSAKRVVETSVQEVLDRLLCKDEAPLPPGGVVDKADFAPSYERGALKAANGRSLRELDLDRSIFRLRCSPLIYSASFRESPPQLKTRVLARLHRVLTDATPEARYSHLATEERAAIHQILTETLPDYAALAGTGP